VRPPEKDGKTKKQTNMPLARLNDYSPNTMMIMGAALSGGDPLKMAKMLLQNQPENQNEPEA
jgi:hypothetical protein